jgi:hypothetical protein
LGGDRRSCVQLGDSEVDNLGKPVAGHHHVLRFEVAMDDACGMGLGEALCDLMSQLHRAAQRHRVLGQDRSNSVSIDPFRCEVGGVAFAADVVDREDVRVVQRRGRARFLLEPRDAIRRSHFGPQHLDRNRAPQPRVFGAVDLAHAARPEKRLEHVRTQASAGGQWHDDADYGMPASTQTLSGIRTRSPAQVSPPKPRGSYRSSLK